MVHAPRKHANNKFGRRRSQRFQGFHSATDPVPELVNSLLTLPTQAGARHSAELRSFRADPL